MGHRASAGGRVSQRYLSPRPAGTFNVLPHKICLPLSHPLVTFLLKTLIAITHTPSCTLSKPLAEGLTPKVGAADAPHPGWRRHVASLPAPNMAAGPSRPRGRGPHNVHAGDPLARTQYGAKRRACDALPPINMAALGVISASFPL